MVAEDERLAREELTYLLQHEEDFILCPSAENGRQLLELYRKYRPDVIFLDIDMPGLTGIEAAKTLAKEGPLFVFTTAYDEYAVKAFELAAVDYLLKPYDAARLSEALSRVRKQLRRQSSPSDKAPSAVPDSAYRPPHPAKLLIEDGEKMVVIDPKRIIYAVRTDRFVHIYTGQESVQSKMSIRELEEKVRDFPFFRPHRSYLVNLEYIQEITPWFNGAYNLVLKDASKTTIPVSRSAAKSLFKLLQQ